LVHFLPLAYKIIESFVSGFKDAEDVGTTYATDDRVFPAKSDRSITLSFSLG
jgi:hypothetical protein